MSSTQPFLESSPDNNLDLLLSHNCSQLLYEYRLTNQPIILGHTVPLPSYLLTPSLLNQITLRNAAVRPTEGGPAQDGAAVSFDLNFPADYWRLV